MSQRSIEARDAVAARPKPAADGIAGRVSIRAATVADAPVLAPLINESYKAREWDLFQHLRTSEEELAAEIAEPNTFVLVAEIEGRPVSCIRVVVRDAEAQFGMLATDLEMQGRGLAPIIIAAAEARVLAEGCDEMHLEVIEDLGLKPYYEALGYREISAERGQHWGAVREWTLVEMAKRLR